MKRFAALSLVAAGALASACLPLPGMPDVPVFLQWVDTLGQRGLVEAYRREVAPYPPLGFVLLAGIGPLASALGIAGSMAGGIIEYLAEGAWTKRMHPGWAAQAGLAAARLGSSGFLGPRTVLEGSHGLFHGFARSTEGDYGVLTDKDAEGHRAYYWGDPWHFALSRMMVACRAYGLRPIDGPFGDFSDPDGYLAAAKRAAVLGFEGKWAIHPSQVDLANQVFTPSEAEVKKAQRIVEAMEQAAKEGKGAVSLDGRLIDIASIRQAQALLNKAKQIKAA